MKNVKKLLGVLLILALVMSMGAAALAEDTASITINRDSTHQTGGTVTDATEYHYYKIFDAVVPDGHELTDDNIEDPVDTTVAGFTYSIQHDSDWYSVVSGMTSYFTLTDKGTYSLVELKEGVEATAATAQAIAAALKAATVDGGGTINKDGDITLGTAVDVTKGYYLIVTTGQPNLVLATTDVTITEKNDYPSVEKEVAEDDTFAQVGKDVTFTITVTVPAEATLPITLTDEMTAGLTFKEITSVVDKNNAAISEAAASSGETPAVTGYTYTAGADDQHFTIVFDAATVQANQGGTMVVTYEATINSAAIVATADVNKVTLTYGNYSQYDTAETDENLFTIRKYDGSDTGETKTPIAGAIFQLKNGDDVISLIKVSDTEYRVADATEAAGTPKSHNAGDTIAAGDLVNDIITVDDTVITIKGVDGQVTTYTLTELKAPTGFNANTTPQTLNVNTENTYEFSMENNKGTELPSTGGIGTTIFYVVGGILVVGAGIVLVSRKKSGDD